MLVAGIALAVGAELIIRALKQQYRGFTFSPLTFFGAVCFIGAIANYVNKPKISYDDLFPLSDLTAVVMTRFGGRLEFHGRYWFTCKIVSQRY